MLALPQRPCHAAPAAGQLPGRHPGRLCQLLRRALAAVAVVVVVAVGGGAVGEEVQLAGQAAGEQRGRSRPGSAVVSPPAGVQCTQHRWSWLASCSAANCCTRYHWAARSIASIWSGWHRLRAANVHVCTRGYDIIAPGLHPAPAAPLLPRMHCAVTSMQIHHAAGPVSPAAIDTLEAAGSTAQQSALQQQASPSVQLLPAPEAGARIVVLLRGQLLLQRAAAPLPHHLESVLNA